VCCVCVKVSVIMVSPVSSVAGLSVLVAMPVSGQYVEHHPTHEESLSEKVINPIAFLMGVTAENKYSPSLWESHGEENEAEGQFVIPFKAFARENLARIKVLK